MHNNSYNNDNIVQSKAHSYITISFFSTEDNNNNKIIETDWNELRLRAQFSFSGLLLLLLLRWWNQFDNNGYGNPWAVPKCCLFVRLCSR